MLLASSGTKAGLETLITQFYAGTVHRIEDDGRVVRVSDGKVSPACVWQKGKRWCFGVPERRPV